MGSGAGPEEDRSIVLTRVFDAPREAVFDAWTDRDHIGEWFGPTGFTLTIHEMDVRPGGVWRFVMHGPDGTDYRNRIDYREVARPERLAYSHGSGDEADAGRFETTVTFEEEEGKTRLTLRMVFDSAEERDRNVEFGAIEGGNQTLERLEEHLAGATR
ncbi:MAG: SRPBCC domain-containing protein [Actinobacteria bacterium]|nr:SRPBCC domain-containing protein [Actinomycetota bacterium]